MYIVIFKFCCNFVRLFYRYFRDEEIGLEVSRLRMYGWQVLKLGFEFKFDFFRFGFFFLYSLVLSFIFWEFFCFVFLGWVLSFIILFWSFIVRGQFRGCVLLGCIFGYFVALFLVCWVSFLGFCILCQLTFFRFRVYFFLWYF